MHLVAASEKKNAVKALGNAKHALHRGRLAKAMASMHTATKAIRIARRATHRMKAWVRPHWTCKKRGGSKPCGGHDVGWRGWRMNGNGRIIGG